MTKSKSRFNKNGGQRKRREVNEKIFKNKVKKKRQGKLKIKNVQHREFFEKNKIQDYKTSKDELQMKSRECLKNNSKAAEKQRKKDEIEHHRKPCMKHKKEKKDRLTDNNVNRKTKLHIREDFEKNHSQHSILLHRKTTEKKSNKETWSRKKVKSFDITAQKARKSEGIHKPVKSVKRPDIWFDDVDMDLIDQAEGKVKPAVKVTEKANPLVKAGSFDGLTKTVAIDCEMVGVGADGSDSILARVSIVNLYGKCVYDKYVKPTEKVTDYRTEVSGIRRADVANGTDFKTVQKEVSDIIRNRLLVGHAIKNDLKVLYLDHPHKMIRDTMRYRPFRAHVNGRNPSLKRLASVVLGVEVQTGEHSSVQDAQAAMRLYTMHKIKWEEELSKKFRKPNPMKWKKSKKLCRNQFVMDLQDSD